MRARGILLVDDDAVFRTRVQKSLGRAFFVTTAATESEFREVYRPFAFDLIILDMRLKTEREGLSLLREIFAYDDLQPVIMVSAYGDTDAVIDSTQAGALMFLHKQDFTPELLGRMVEAVLEQGRIRRHLASLKNRINPGSSVVFSGSNPAVRRALEGISRASEDADSLVVVSGERGSGHDLVAQSIHDNSRWRAGSPLIFADAAASGSDDPRGVIFGRNGGAGQRRKGLLEQANGGLLLLHETDRLEWEVRAELGKTIRGRELNLGGNGTSIPLDLQLVAATESAGAHNVAESLFDASSGDRLVEIQLPPLRDRREDIAVLATFFLGEFRRCGRTSARSMSREFLGALEQYSWPGNMEELRNMVEFGAIRTAIAQRDEIRVEDLPHNFSQNSRPTGGGERWEYRYHIARAEVSLVDRARRSNEGLNKTQMAEMLGYSDRFAFSRRLRKIFEDFHEMAGEFPAVAGMFGTGS